MILKKPYAFLIKNFRIIHVLLTILCIFITYKSHNIVVFFREFIRNNYSVTVTDNILSTTIGFAIYIAIILTIIILIAIYVLLKTKKKPNKIYLISIIYYMVLFIFIIIAGALINSLHDGLWSTASARTYRDIANIIYFPMYFFTILMFIRSLGFNVKQFNFQDDLKQLEVTDTDSEEIELNINFKTYKAERLIRRFIREFKYYFLENKRVIIAIGIVILLFGGYSYFKNFEKVHYSYKENKSFNYSYFNINVLDSMVTNVDLKGNIIESGKYYVVLKFSIKNNSKDDQYLDYNNLKLYYGNKFVYPSLDLGNYFLDYGDPFMNDWLPAGDTHTYIIPYEIDEKVKNSSFKLELYSGVSIKSKNFLAKTITVKIKPLLYENTQVVRNAKLNENVSFASTNLKDSSLTIKSASITKRFEYTYKSCYKDNCRNYTDIIAGDGTYQNQQTLVVMDYDLTLDNTAASYININEINAFVENFWQIKYTINDNEKIVSVKNVTPTNLKNKLVVQTDGNVMNADKIDLLVTIRNRCYDISLR